MLSLTTNAKLRGSNPRHIIFSILSFFIYTFTIYTILYEKFRYREEIGRNWFTNKVVDEWNRLSSHVVNAPSIGSFKNRLDRFMDGDVRWS